ncbi:MAG: thiamine-phosphate kinase [candidate division WOR-3 bacterium]|nr:MAG: thiamine-phosphate kinase [candidate division WOR-3 bacterium]
MKKRFQKKPLRESEIIDYLKKRYRRTGKEIVCGIGDDAAVLQNGYVVSIDSFFDTVHFDLNYFSMQALGHHVMAASLSDLAAMAAQPVCVLCALSITQDLSFDDVVQLYRGFEQLSNTYRFDIVGGEVAKSTAFGVTITVIGLTRKPLLRSSAAPGHDLYVTGFLGLAEVGRMVLKEQMPEKEFPDAVQKHRYPEPRIREAREIARFCGACIDTSDGLSTDAGHLARESKVKIRIESEHVPIHPEVGRFCARKRIDPMEFILSAGEDFELLFSAVRTPRLPRIKIFRIGKVLRGKGVYLAERGRERGLRTTGYEHTV